MALLSWLPLPAGVGAFLAFPLVLATFGGHLLVGHALLVTPPSIDPGNKVSLSRRRQFSVLQATTPSTSRSNSSAYCINNHKMNKMRLVQGMRDIVDDYDVFLLDMWGVMHDGSAPYDGVLDVVQQLRRLRPPRNHKKQLVILSNSSKRTDHTVRMLAKLGFQHTDFCKIITSGEVAFNLLQQEESPPFWDRTTDRKVFVLGSGDGDAEYCESSGWSLAPVHEASLIVARGTFTIDDYDNDNSVIHKNHDPARYEAVLQERLQQAAARRLPMLVCNPDKVRPDADRPPMPGKLGDMYEQLLRGRGGAAESAASLVRRIGKPFADVYDLALAATGSPDPSRVCMIGDALETDVTGGSRAGMATVWVLADGIHSPDLSSLGESSSLEAGAASVLDSFNSQASHETYAAGQRLAPDMIMEHFRW